MESVQQCTFCNQRALFKSRDSDFAYYVNCPNCGDYVIETTSIDEDYENKKHLISGFIREKNDLELELEKITQENIPSILNDPMIPKFFMEKLHKIILYLYRNTESFGKEIGVGYDDYSRGYAKNQDEYKKMIETLIQIGYLSGHTSNISFNVSVTIKGFLKAEELLSTYIYSNQVFVAMGFDKDLLEAHKKAIIPACKECGYDARLISENEHNDEITDRIIAEIKRSKFVITDFTYNNQGAYFEAGFAQGRGLPVIRTCKKDWFEEKDTGGNLINRLHFDINHYNFILWENHKDLKEKLINRIRATIL